jgi:hypothetical protein
LALILVSFMCCIAANVAASAHAGTTVAAVVGAPPAFVRTAGPSVPSTPRAVPLPQTRLPVADRAIGDFFGASVAISGDTAVVGAPAPSFAGGTTAGAAYVYARSSGVWKFQKKLMPGFGAVDDIFGYAVAISGNTVVVGAPGHDYGVADSGAVYVYVRSNGKWSLQQQISAGDFAASDGFGHSVAVSGDTALIGAPGRDSAGKSNSGAAYVYVRTGGVWAQQQTLSTGGAVDDHFGDAVALSGDLALIGVPDLDPFAMIDTGAAYAYARTNGVWTAAPVLYAVGTLGDGDHFGSSVSLSGTTALIGASGHDVGGQNAAGAAYVFQRAGGVWGPPSILAAGVTSGDNLGTAVAISRDTAVIASNDAAGGPTAPSVAYVIRRVGGVWQTTRTTLKTASGEGGDRFGGALGVSGDTVVVGADLHDSAGVANSGAAYAFAPNPMILKLSPTSGRRGTLVTISGRGFGRTRGASVVKFGTARCTKFVSWNSTRIRCRVPATAAFGARQIKVILTSHASNTRRFTVKR